MLSWFSKVFRRKKNEEENSQEGEKDSNWEFMRELSPEREEELINNLVAKIKKSAFREYAPLYFHMLEPFSTISSSFAMLITPYIDTVTNFNSGDYALLLQKKENVKKILEKLENEE